MDFDSMPKATLLPEHDMPTAMVKDSPNFGVGFYASAGLRDPSMPCPACMEVGYLFDVVEDHVIDHKIVETQGFTCGACDSFWLHADSLARLETARGHAKGSLPDWMAVVPLRGEGDHEVPLHLRHVALH